MSATTTRRAEFDPGGMITEFAMHRGEMVTVRFDHIEAGALTRRHVRAAFNLARIRGAEVDVREERGWLDSVFAVRMRGTTEQLRPSLLALAALAEEA